MSVEQNKATLMRMYDEVYNKGNLSLAPELVAPGYHFGNLKGPEGWKQAVTSWRTAFPDIQFTVEDAVGEGDWIAYRLSIEGTFKGKWRDIEPTGKKVKGTLAFFSQYEDGKLLTSFAFADQLAMYQAMGVTPPGSAETQEANKATLRRYYEEVLNKGNYSLWGELMTDDYVLRSPSGELRGMEAGKQNYAQRKAMSSDSLFTVDEIVAEGDRVVVRGAVKGTHNGEFQGIAPTGKTFVRAYAAYYRFRGGKIAEGWTVQDVLGTYQQLGITPPGPAEANKAVVKRYFEEVLNKGNTSLLDELMDENYVMLRANGEIDNQGREGNKKMFAQTRASVPDIHVLIDDMVAEGDKVVVTGTWEGTHTAAIQGVPATGKHFKYGYTATYTVVDGKIASGRIVSDTMTLFQQLGVTPPVFARTAEANKAAVRRTMEEIWNKGDLSKVPELVASDYVGHQLVGDIRGQEGFSNMINSARKAVPDLHCEVDDLVVEGDNVVCRYTMTGTDTSGVGGAAPTGKKISMRSMYLTRMKDGKSAETWALSDRLGVYQQLGITPPTK